MLKEVLIEDILQDHIKDTKIWAFNAEAEEPKMFELRDVLKGVRLMVDYKEPEKLTPAEVDCLKLPPAEPKKEEPRQKRKYTKRKEKEAPKAEKEGTQPSKRTNPGRTPGNVKGNSQRSL